MPLRKIIEQLPSRRSFIKLAGFGITSLAIRSRFAIVPESDPISGMTDKRSTFRVHSWMRDSRNPILTPGGGWYDVGCCMNPFALRVNDEYYLYYAGADKNGGRRICLAIAPVTDVTKWIRIGPLFEQGKKGSFDENWCVLPCVHKINGKWHLYFSGQSADQGAGLQGFRGIGLAVSDDLKTWSRYSEDPILLGDGFPEWPDNKGIAGGGRILEIPQKDGRILYRMHYTLANGVPGNTLQINQAKQSVIAHSYDGLTWFDKRVVMRPRAEAEYENAATIALNVWKTEKRWRAIYAGIGTQFGAYSICEAVSDDGLVWDRGKPGANLALPPIGDGWESKMTEYPNVLEENGKLRLFYCGNGYGATGIGTATAEILD